MAKAYHNFRVQVAGDGFVRIQEWGAQDPSPQEKPARPFRKKELLDNEEIKTLLEAASQGELSDSEQVIRLGEALFEALFDEKLLDTFVESYKNHALDKNQLFRFELDIDE